MESTWTLGTLEKDGENTEQATLPPNPEVSANFLSRLTFTYLDAIMVNGYKRPLVMNDLYELPDELHSRTIADRFGRNWDRELSINKEYLKHAKPDGSIDPSLKIKRPSLLRALWRTFGISWVLGGIFRLVSDGCQIAAPMVLQYLIAWLTAASVGQTTVDVGYGYGLACALLALQLVLSLFVNQYFYATMKVGFSIRAAIIVHIYRKSLLLSQSARQDFSAGKTVNLMSTDASRLDLTAPFLHLLWAAPIVILVSMSLLIYNLGASALVGFFFLIIVFPAQGVLMKYLVKVRTKANKITDNRVKIVQEFIQGMRVLKFQGWEQAALNRIAKLRDEELSFVRIIIMARAWISAVMQIQPVFAAILTFITYTQTHPPGSLTPALAFSSIGLFNVLRLPLMFLPQVATQATDAMVSIRRLESLLLATELQESTIVPASYNWAVRVHDGLFLWDQPSNGGDDFSRSKDKKKQVQNGNPTPNGTPRRAMTTLLTKSPTEIAGKESKKDRPAQENGHTILRGVDFVLPKGALMMVVGPVGSGKSSLLSALVGEMRRVEGLVEVRGSVAYCPQQAWIQNATVRANITFGNTFNERKYWETIRACAMERDLEILTDGDFTEIGERGINLSGGQKQRVSIARAVYSDADIVLLDDPLSAVDAHVGRHIFDHCICGALAEKTRILSTHQIHILPQGKYKWRFTDGRIVEQGTYADLVASEGGYLQSMVKEYGGANDDDSNLPKEVDVQKKKAADKSLHDLAKTKRRAGTKGQDGTLMSEEEKMEGAVAFKVYKDYFRLAGGWIVVLGIVASLALTQGARIATDSWLAAFTSNRLAGDMGYFSGVYIAWGTSQGIAVLVTGYLFSTGCIWASRRLHASAADRLFRAPISFFDTTPVGRIMNRFSKDIDSIDNVLPETLRMATSTFSLIAATVILIGVVLPIFFAPLVPLLIICDSLTPTRFYRATSRELKRLDSVSKSPLYAHFSESLTGLPTIRAYNAQERFRKINEERLDANGRAYWLSITTQRWIDWRLGLIASLLVFGAAILGVAGRGSILGPGVIGLALTYSLNVTGTLNWMVRQLAETEMQMNGVERLIYYAEDLDTEAAMVIEQNRPPQNWPDKGEIRFQDLQMRYRPDLPTVLKKINLHIMPGEKVGFVGRTGAGKSSIMIALFRLSEKSSGSIVIDGIDISSIGLNDLRSRLAIIPQDPVLFSGTIRYNLDPFDEYDDPALWDVLSRCGDLKDVIEKSADKLDMPVSENGENFSVGQRQLLCLARAMLRDARVVVMDEATASVDLATDDLIQRTIRTDERFSTKTVLTIAHRLNTIIDYDKVVVMSDGQVAEFGSPKELASKRDGILRKLIDETGPENSKVLLRLAGIDVVAASTS
ncbi:hypothetical protein M427DRAFT_95715 [Gonapodya prolifera JEL478]|uniref:P-loop containing nucleoside triphosphate hydrolase protein n=1 Tax=Gonapodya prolifera (strain JEL478) TaxID=1344416 RepID=A0A139AQE1_GONPJ|nr:hypothetical protein M427DRAFT_95715 [Gonapodya prolifera JEL478]|eukprot:KXS18959.1 hypothetical protein M427DRAFT_95715 [Gonapodya prolifera JEL478]